MRLASLALTLGLSIVPAGMALAAEPFEVVETAPEGGVRVGINKMKYLTPVARIKVGETVTWENQEGMPHNVQFKKAANVPTELKGPLLRAKQSYTLKFNTPGTYDYVCTPHPFMKGKVVVQ